MKKEKMRKVHNGFGAGFLELCNTVESFAQAFDQEKVCRCDHCLQFKGEEEIVRMEMAREKKLKSFTFGDFSLATCKIISLDRHYGADYGNRCWDEWNDEDDEYSTTYRTGGGLRLAITELKAGGYLFEVYPPEKDVEVFRDGSTLCAALGAVGYELKIYDES